MDLRCGSLEPLQTNRKDKVGKRERYSYIQAARDLGYNDSVIAKLYSAKTETEISNIMASARKKGTNYEELADGN